MERIAAGGCAGIILREKDLEPIAYQDLARQVISICQSSRAPCILHGNPEAAGALGVESIHLPMPVLRSLSQRQRECFRVLGASCHSVEEAREAETLGCTYIIAGHVFATDCKKDLNPRGLRFLQEVCRGVHIPVWAIGGITPENIRAVLDTGARGGCVMSGLMTCEDPQALLDALKRYDRQDG